jgi:3-oxoadipate enol-lactonase/4-carboxymuconolactone decarboxylase
MPLIAVNGTQLFYDLAGPEGAPVVLFSNSLGTTAEMWDAQARALAGRCRVLRYDTRGHGRSQTTGPVRLETLVRDAIGLLDALQISSAHVVGLSLGGMTAQALGIHYPTRVRSLVLMATAAYLPPADGWHLRAKTVREEGLGAIVDGAMTRWFTQGIDRHAPERKQFTRQRFLSSDAEGYALCCEALAMADLRADLGRIKAPTLVMAAEGDPVTTVAMGLDLAAAIGDARFEPVSEAAHLFAVEQPEQINRHLLSWLDQQGALVEPDGRFVFEQGLANRKAVLGIDHVQRSFGNANDFTRPWHDFITRMAWGEAWGNPDLAWKLRSVSTLSMMVALHREEEFKLHLRPALKNGLTVKELQALLLHCSIYAGVPASNAAFRWARDVLGEESDHVNDVL